jgi:hypothetical protein
MIGVNQGVQQLVVDAGNSTGTGSTSNGTGSTPGSKTP